MEYFIAGMISLKKKEKDNEVKQNQGEGGQQAYAEKKWPNIFTL